MSNYNFDVSFYFDKKGVFRPIFQGRRIWRELSGYELRRFVLRTTDREDINRVLGTTSTECRLTPDDIKRFEEVLEDGNFESTDWKELDNMRICTFQEMISMVVIMNIPKCTVDFKSKGLVYDNVLTRACAAYLRESSQCQIDITDTEIARLALRQKIAMPIHAYDGVNAADPHESWLGYIDSVDSPQSEKCGAIVARCDGVRIEDGKFTNRSIGIYSTLMRKSVQFPQFLKTHRQVMCSAISKQGCKLGRDGEFNEKQIVRPADCEDIPDLMGRNVTLGIMDWNLYTHEDACVISQDLADHMSTFKTVTSTFADANGDMSLLIEEGDEVKPNGVVGLYSDSTMMRGQNRVPGKLVEILKFDHEIEGKKVQCYRLSIECEYKCDVGSKLSNLHSCKSIVSKILENERMPLMKDGTRVDMLISPMSIGNRVNPSLIVEGMLGMYCVKEDAEIETFPFDPSITFIDEEQEIHLPTMMENCNLPRDCCFPLRNGEKGKEFDYRTFVGKVFVMRLHHHADEKMIWQNKTTYDQNGLTIAGVGNTRYGREEIEILYQHRADNIINEMIESSRRSSVGTLISGLVETIGYAYVE